MLATFLGAEHNHTNALKDEHSPYLQQHIHNPVNWYPWGEEAFRKAEKENKLIFLSIGYSTCHWCHVMEEESFTDEEVAKLLNDDFISIKVDREEYSQIDKKYQKLYMDVHGKRGGWPLSVFMSSKKEVFYIATYITKDKGYGSKGLTSLLPAFVALQKKNSAFLKAIREYEIVKPKAALIRKLNTNLINAVVDEISKAFDPINGGFATRPKFPEASKLELLLDIYKLNGNKKALEMALLTLKKMAQSGIYDQVGGGFFRYTTDYEWQIPHFEKMLYTNAELVSVYAKAYQLTGDTLFKKIVDETIAQMEKNYMQEGVYLSASDADSNGEEGGYFIYEYIEVQSELKEKGWKPQEIEDALGYLGIVEDGNIDGDFSHTHITSDNVPARIEELKTHLKEVSSKRTFPFIDKKVITAWNAMMVKALFMASKTDSKYLKLGKQRLDNLLTLMKKETQLYHQRLLDKEVKQKALLEDYAFLIDALIEAYQRTYDLKYLNESEVLTKQVLKKFYKMKRWYLSNDGVEAYADFDDRYYTAALSKMLENFVRMATLTEELKYSTIVKETIANLGSVLEKSPSDASKLVHTFLRLELGDVIIHADKNKLLIAQNELDTIGYPFILSGEQESESYLACKTTMCFAYDKNITKLIDKIEKVMP